ncbi:hypothetical protein B1813_03795 [Saccharomonospora piscinae]|uniref:Uncharacterized protein n=1 Tax=Saccharomonospora piscinae TaxID=687388 RepID=A0A1V9A9A3_SACPI|nr:hypothetical protein B1813_03795 [Saccharomonospora piscinae]
MFIGVHILSVGRLVFTSAHGLGRSRRRATPFGCALDYPLRGGTLALRTHPFGALYALKG